MAQAGEHLPGRRHTARLAQNVVCEHHDGISAEDNGLGKTLRHGVRFGPRHAKGIGPRGLVRPAMLLDRRWRDRERQAELGEQFLSPG